MSAFTCLRGPFGYRFLSFLLLVFLFASLPSQGAVALWTAEVLPVEMTTAVSSKATKFSTAKKWEKQNKGDQAKLVGMLILISLLFIAYLLFVAILAFMFAYSGYNGGAMVVIVFGLALGLIWYIRWIKARIRKHRTNRLR